MSDLQGTRHDQSPIVFVMCPENFGTYVHQDATRWYCPGCRKVHLVDV